MTSLEALRTEVLERLRADSRFEGVAIAEEYAGTPRTLPVGGRLLTVGIERVQLSPGGMGEAACLSRGPVALGPFAEVTLRFDLRLPREESLPGYLIDSLYDCLLTLGVTRLESEPVKPEPAALATRLCVKASLPAVLTRPDERQFITELILKRRDDLG